MTGIDQAHDMPRLNREKLNEIKDIMGNEIQDIISEFSRIAPNALATIASSLQSNDTERVFVEAHTLKSSSDIIGLSRFSRLCAILEVQARNNDMVKPENQLQLLKTELPIGIDAINSLLRK